VEYHVHKFASLLQVFLQPPTDKVIYVPLSQSLPSSNTQSHADTAVLDLMGMEARILMHLVGCSTESAALLSLSGSCTHNHRNAIWMLATSQLTCYYVLATP
jgi:hypothetical protein